MIKSQKVQGAPGTPGAAVDLGLLEDGNVAMQFPERIRQIVFSPAQAKQLGLGLIELGTHGESVQRMAPPEKTGAMPRRKM